MPQTPSDDDRPHPVRDVVESTGAKFVASVIVPALLTALIVVCGFIGTRLVTQLDTQGTELTTLKTDVRVLTTRLDEGVIRQVESNSRRLDDHQKRIETLERTTRTP